MGTILLCWCGFGGLPTATKSPEKPLTAGVVGLPWIGSGGACGFPQGFTPSWLISCPNKKTKKILLPAVMLLRILTAC